MIGEFPVEVGSLQVAVIVVTLAENFRSLGTPGLSITTMGIGMGEGFGTEGNVEPKTPELFVPQQSMA